MYWHIMTAERYDYILALGVVILSRLSFFSSDFTELSELSCSYDYSRNFIRIRPYGLWQIPHIAFSSFFPLSFLSFVPFSFHFSFFLPLFLFFPPSFSPFSFPPLPSFIIPYISFLFSILKICCEG